MGEVLSDIGEMFRVGAAGPWGAAAVISATAILAVANVMAARGGRVHLRDPSALKQAVARLEDWLHALTNPKVRVQIVNAQTGELLFRLPADGKEWAMAIEFLNLRHRQNLEVSDHIRPYLTRREKSRLARKRGQVDRKRSKVQKLMSAAEQHQRKGHADKADKMGRKAFLAIAVHLDSVVDFERRLVAAIHSSLNYYQECLLNA